MHGSHAASATTGHRLDHDGAALAQRAQKSLRLFKRNRTVAARNQRHATARSQRLGLDLVAESFKRIDPRPDEAHPCFCAGPRQIRVFAQKAISGMQGITAGCLGRGDDRVDVEIGPCTGTRQSDRLIGLAHMQGRGIV